MFRGERTGATPFTAPLHRDRFVLEAEGREGRWEGVSAWQEEDGSKSIDFL